MAVVTMASNNTVPSHSSVVQFGEIVSSERDLSPEDQDLLADIRRRKLQLIQEILMLRNEIAEVNREQIILFSIFSNRVLYQDLDCAT